MKLILTIPGMGKTTYVKERREEFPIGEAPVVDFDYKCAWKLFDSKVRNAHAKTVQALFESGYADVILVNTGFVNLDALPPNLCEIVALFPNDPTDVQKRLEERDGSNVFSGLVDGFVSDLRTLYESNKRRLGIVEAFADTVTDYMNSLDGQDAESEEEPESEEESQQTVDPNGNEVEDKEVIADEVHDDISVESNDEAEKPIL